MTDIYLKKRRSEIMASISSRETKIEKLVRSYLFHRGFRFRKNVKSLPGKPDIFLPKFKIVIFVNGCFWHGHDCKAAKLPSTRKEFWTNKINENIDRDRKNILACKELGLKTISIWQCELKNAERRQKTLENTISSILN